MNLNFSPDSQWLVVAAFDGFVQVWDARTGVKVTEPLAGHLAGTIKASFSADSRSLVTYGADHAAKIWNVATGREMMSGLPLNWFMVYHADWNLLPTEGNSVVESAGTSRIQVVCLPTLAEIDALEERR
jgi:WD40 repeat protein